MLAAAAAFGQTIGPITEPIEQGVAALVALGDLAQVNGSRIDARMSAFADIMGGLTQHMRRVAAYFTADMLAAAVAFGQAIGPITEPIETGVAALIALSQAAWGDAPTLVARMIEFTTHMYNLATLMGSTAQVMRSDTVAAAVLFATAVDAIVAPIDAGLKALATLMAAGVISAIEVAVRMVAFSTNMISVVTILAWTGQQIGADATTAAARFGVFANQVDDIIQATVNASNDMVQRAVVASANFKWAAERTAENILIGLLSASGLEGWGDSLPQIMERLTSSVVGAMWTISGAWQSLAWAGYLFGQNWVGQIINGITSRLHDLQALLAYIRGLFPSSPAQFGAWRTLPDGAAVGGAFVGDLSGALAPNRVQGALAGLHDLFGDMGAPTGSGAAANAAARNITVTINNPVGEPAEASLLRSMRNLAAVGVL